MTYRQTADFLLYDWLDVESLAARPRFADHSRETFASVMDTCEKIAREKFAPFNRLADTEEPWFDGEKVHLPEASHAAARAYAESGMLAAAQDYEIGGMQLPCVVEMAANSFFSKAGIGIGGGGMLTSGNANLLMAHGTPAQQEAFAGTSSPAASPARCACRSRRPARACPTSSTRAAPDGADFERDPLGPRYRLRGNKMWISNGEHELAENIVHLVLAKIPGPDGKPIPGTRGISLFIVPKKLVDADGDSPASATTSRWPGSITSSAIAASRTRCSISAKASIPVRGARRRDRLPRRQAARGPALHVPHDERGAHRRRPGRDDARLRGLRGLARLREEPPAGPPIGPGGKDATQPQVPIIGHADVKRMLLAQKSYCEGALALELYCARLVDELHTGATGGGREPACCSRC